MASNTNRLYVLQCVVNSLCFTKLVRHASASFHTQGNQDNQVMLLSKDQLFCLFNQVMVLSQDQLFNQVMVLSQDQLFPL